MLAAGLGAALLTGQPGYSQQLKVDRIDARLQNDSPNALERLELRVEKALALLCVHVPSAIRLAQQTRDAARRVGRPDLAAIALAIESSGVISRRGRTAAQQLMLEARRTMPEDSPAVRRGRLELMASDLAYLTDHYGAATQRLQRAMALAHESGDRRLEAFCLVSLSDLLSAISIGHIPSDDLQRAKNILQEAGDLSGLLHIDTRIADVLMTDGREDEARALALQTIEEGRRVGDRIAIFNAWQLLASHAWEVTEFEAGLEYGAEMLAVARRLEDQQMIASALDTVAWSHLRLGDHKAAAPYVEEATELTTSLDLPALEVQVRLSACELALARRDSAALMKHSLRIAELRDYHGTGTDSADHALAIRELRSMRGEQRALHDNLRAGEEELALYRWIGLLSLLTLTASVAILLLVGKKRVERMHLRLHEETRRAKLHAAARRKLEQQVRHIERLDSVGLLAAGIAHDFNNILCSILANAELLLEEHDMNDRDMVQSIIKASTRATALCAKLMDYSKPELVDPAILDLNVLVEDVRRLMYNGDGRGPKIEAQIASEPVYAEVDRAGMERVLINLVINARDSGAGKVTMAVRCDASIERNSSCSALFGKVRHPGRNQMIEVADDGKGMTTEVLNRVFDPFFTTKFEGRGLGMSAAYGIVTRHGGAFRVTSEPGNGTSFCVILPSAAEQDQPRQLTAEPSKPTAARLPDANGDRRSILTVDDEPQVLNLVQRILEPKGWTVHSASSGAEGLRMLDDVAAAGTVVLLDLAMPEMDGRAVLQAIRSNHSDTEVVLMSGHGDLFVQEHLRGLDVGPILKKPFSIRQLEAALPPARQTSGA